MVRSRAFLVGSGALVLSVVILACSDDASRPRAANLDNATTSSGGSSSSSGGGPSDGSAQGDGSSGNDGGSSSGGSSGTSSGFIETGFRATIDAVATELDVTPRAVRQSAGFVIEMSGKSAAGDELRITMTNGSGMVAPGAYNCTGSAGNEYSVMSYTTPNGAETWSGVANGACTVTVQSIDNQTNGVTVGTFSATLEKVGSPDKVVTGGQFRLTLD